MKTRKIIQTIVAMFIMVVLTINSQAQTNASQQAGNGAGNGALIGALAGVVFGDGDVLGDAVGGALIGGGIGAVAGAINGSATDKQIQREVDALIKEYGENNIRGYVELMECRHDKALAYFKVEELSSNPNHKLSSIWLQALTEKDRRNAEQSEVLNNTLVEVDRDIDEIQQAELAVNQLVLDLRQDRKSYQIGCQ